ncbi:MAG: acyltransferase [Caulobacter sp.]|nr:acyltransferase [Caulobacter sp.]
MSGRLAALDGVRGVAALLVMGLHIAGYLGSPLLGHGYLMVDLFFLMSGFVLSAGYGQRLAAGGQGVWFAGKRIARLYPLAIVGLTLGAAAALALSLGGLRPLEDQPLLLALLAALFLPWLGGGLVVPFNGPVWSLQYELWINLAWGFVARWLTDRRLAVLTGLAALALVLVVGANGQFDSGFANNDPARAAGPLSWLSGWTRVAFAFPMGVLLHRLWAAGRLGGVTSRFASWLLPLSLLLIALPVPGLTPLYDLAAVFLLFPVLVVLGANAAGGGRLQALLGRLSYGVYVLHGPILLLFKTLEPTGLTLPLRLGWYGLAAILAIAAAALAERWIDRPVRKWVARRDAAEATTALTGPVQARSA